MCRAPLGASVEGAPGEEGRGTAWAWPWRRSPVLHGSPQQGGGGGAGCQPRGCRVHSTGSSGLSVACSSSLNRCPGTSRNSSLCSSLAMTTFTSICARGGGVGVGVSGVNEGMNSKCHSCLGPQPPAPSPGTQSRALKCFLDKTSPRSHFWAETPALAPYLSKLLPNAGAGSQGEWEVGELRPACRERGVRRQPRDSCDKANLVMTGFGPGLVFEHAKDINSLLG